MQRAIKLTLKYVTGKKRRAINALLSRYRSAVNFYIRSLWQTPGALDKATKARLQGTELSSRYLSNALKQALETVSATKKSARVLGVKASCPRLAGAATLAGTLVKVEKGEGSFDVVIRLSGLVPRKLITIPTKATAVLNSWLARKDAVLVQGCGLSENKLIVWVEVPDEEPKEGEVIGVDIGKNKLISDSDGNHYGREFSKICNKIRRSKRKSKARYRHFDERENYINFVVNQLPWDKLSCIGVEDLCDLKRGKQKKRGKSFRKALAPWTYRRVLDRIGHKAQENRVRLVAVPPAYTSQKCPACSKVTSENRKGEHFQCVRCGYGNDADTVGALNVLARTLDTLGSLQSPRLKGREAAVVINDYSMLNC